MFTSTVHLMGTVLMMTGLYYSAAVPREPKGSLKCTVQLVTVRYSTLSTVRTYLLKRLLLYSKRISTVQYILYNVYST